MSWSPLRAACHAYPGRAHALQQPHTASMDGKVQVQASVFACVHACACSTARLDQPDQPRAPHAAVQRHCLLPKVHSLYCTVLYCAVVRFVLQAWTSWWTPGPASTQRMSTSCTGQSSGASVCGLRRRTQGRAASTRPRHARAGRWAGLMLWGRGTTSSTAVICMSDGRGSGAACVRPSLLRPLRGGAGRPAWHTGRR